VSDERAGSDGEGASGALSGGRLGAAALLLAASVLLSRVMGFLREMVLAAEVGVGPETDAYRAAFQIPDLLNYLLAGGALAVAFTPLYQRARTEEGEAAAARLYHVIVSTLGALAAVATAALWVTTPRLVSLQFSGFEPEVRDLTSHLTRIVLPAQVFFIVGGIARAVLMAHGRFAAQAAAPLVYNGGIIAGGLATGTVEGFAWGALVGAAIGPCLYPLWALRTIAPLRVAVRPFDPRFLGYFWLALPLMAGLSLSTVDEWFGRWFGAQLAEGTVAALGYARQLMMAPVAVIGQAAAAAALPTLAALHARGDTRGLDAALSNTLRVTLALSMLCAIGLGLFAKDIVEVLYLRGRFSMDNVVAVAVILQVSACAVPAWTAQQVAVRAFFARSENWRPMILNTGVLLLSVPVYLDLGERYGAAGLAAAGVLAMTVNAAATLGWARVRFGGPAVGPIAMTALRAGLVGGAAGWAAAGVPDIALPGLGLAWGRLATAGLLYGVLALGGAVALGDPPMRRAAATWTRGRLGRRT
jgi:putative peptidoglycan lipid II flippase